MTDEQHALMLLATGSHPDRQKALDRFHDRWKGDNLVIDTWFAAQAHYPQRSAHRAGQGFDAPSIIQPRRAQQSARADRYVRDAEPGAVPPSGRGRV